MPDMLTFAITIVASLLLLTPALAASAPKDATPGVQVGELAPPFTLHGFPEGEYSLEDAEGKFLVLYFYPKDETPGCTKEACAFRDLQADFAKQGALIWGVSADSLESHQDFSTNHTLNFPLLADPEGKLRARFGNPEGEQEPLEMRITYIIDAKGVVRAIVHGEAARNWEEHISGAQAAIKELANTQQAAILQ